MAPDRSGPRTIDVHTHVIPRRLAESAERGEARHGITFGRDTSGRITGSVGPTTFAIAWPNPLETPEERLRAMDEMRVDMHVLSLEPADALVRARRQRRRTDGEGSERRCRRDGRHRSGPVRRSRLPPSAGSGRSRCRTGEVHQGPRLRWRHGGESRQRSRLGCRRAVPGVGRRPRSGGAGVRPSRPWPGQHISHPLPPAQSDRQPVRDHRRRRQPHLWRCARPAA